MIFLNKKSSLISNQRNNLMAESILVELLEVVSLEKENFPTIEYEVGTVLKVVLTSPKTILVSTEPNVNFTLQLADENKVWRRI